MYSSNPPPLNTTTTTSSSTPTRRSSTSVLEPYALHIISSVIRDLQFLRQQGYISITALEEIIERLPKPVVHTIPHTPPSAPSPSSSPKPKSPTVSVKSDTSQKPISTFIAPQRPLSAPSETSQNQEQPSHPLARSEPGTVKVDEDQNLKSHHKPLPITIPPPPTTQPIRDSNQDERNDDNVVNAGQPQPENPSSIPKPAVPSRLSVYIPQSSSSTSSSTSTGAILATRPLPLPPNVSHSSPPRPQPLPVFNNKHEEAEYEKSMNYQVLKDAVLPAYSLSTVEAMWDFMGDDAGDLSFIKGDVIEVVEYVNGDWWRGRIQRTNKIGIFPKVYTKIMQDQSNGYYSQRLPQHSNSISAYTSQTIRPYVNQSPSLQQQQLPTQQQLTTQQLTAQQLTAQQLTAQQLTAQQLTAQQNYTYQQQYANHSYASTRTSTTTLNGQQQQFYRNL